MFLCNTVDGDRGSKKAKGGAVDKLDGVTLEFKDGSNSFPVEAWMARLAHLETLAFIPDH